MSRLIQGVVALRTGQTRDGRSYDYACINLAGMTFTADLNSERDERVVRRIARDAGSEVIDWREENDTCRN